MKHDQSYTYSQLNDHALPNTVSCIELHAKQFNRAASLRGSLMHVYLALLYAPVSL